jgi:hypothetical protein
MGSSERHNTLLAPVKIKLELEREKFTIGSQFFIILFEVKITCLNKI